jgi:hypothetical protein
VKFEEFLQWWAKNFYHIVMTQEATTRKNTKLPFENFYRGIRSVNTMTPDPPAYFKGELVTDVLQLQGLSEEEIEAIRARSKEARSRGTVEREPTELSFGPEATEPEHGQWLARRCSFEMPEEKLDIAHLKLRQEVFGNSSSVQPSRLARLKSNITKAKSESSWSGAR